MSDNEGKERADAAIAAVLALCEALDDDARTIIKLHATANGGDMALAGLVADVDRVLKTLPAHNAFPLTVAFSLGYQSSENAKTFTGAVLALMAGRLARRLRESGEVSP